MGHRTIFWQPDFPFSPRRLPIFYGWVILVAAAIGIAASIPGQTMGVSVFTESLMAALELTRTQLSLAYLVGTTASGLLLPRGGRLLDHLGARRTMTLSTIAFAGTVALFATSDAVARAGQKILHTSELWPVSLVVMALGFFLIRFLGQGMMTVTSRTMLGKWFDRRRGLVFAISGVAISFAFSAAPHPMNALIDATGWREAYLWMGAGLAVVALIAWIVFRDNPEECGLEMDGGPIPNATSAENPDRVIVRDLTRAEAVRTFSFWAFNLGTAWQAFAITAYTFHVIAIGAEAGLTKPDILLLFLPMSGVGVFTNFFSGWLVDRTRAKYILLLLLGGLIVAGIGMAQLSTSTGRLLLVVGLGISGGAFQTTTGIVWPRYFGRSHLGAISGLNMSTIVLASALGPYAFSLSKEYAGSFQVGFLATIIVPTTLFVAAFFADNPQRDLRPE
ncbi:MAG: MFS transporter [Chthoniobacterales bacterium]